MPVIKKGTEYVVCLNESSESENDTSPLIVPLIRPRAYLCFCAQCQADSTENLHNVDTKTYITKAVQQELVVKDHQVLAPFKEFGCSPNCQYNCTGCSRERFCVPECMCPCHDDMD